MNSPLTVVKRQLPLIFASLLEFLGYAEAPDELSMSQAQALR